MTTKTIYIPYAIAEVLPQAFEQIAKDYNLINDSIEVVNNGEDRASWMELYKETEERYLFLLGVTVGKLMNKD